MGNNREYIHICEVCGRREILTPEEGYEKGWDYPLSTCSFGSIAPRKCGNCSITETLWWAMVNSVLEKNGTGEDKPCFYDLKISEDAVEQVCAYIYAMNSAKLPRRMLPRKFSEIDYIVSSKLKDIKLDYPYCRDEIEQFIKHRYLSDIYDEAYEVFMMQPYNGKDIYLDRLVPVLDYEIVIVEHFEMVDIFLFKTLTNGMKYESFFKESSKHVSGYKPF